VNIKLALLVNLIMTLSGSVFGQAVKISVTDTHRDPLVGATIQMINVVDSTQFFATTNQYGSGIINDVEQGLYTIKISYIGYKPIEKNISIKPDKREFSFQLSEDAIALNEVTVEARKPLIRHEDDKMIIDPEPLALVTTNTLEVLESTPGIYVDQDGGIYLNGASPAAIYINGREQKMSSQDIAMILRSLPPGSIQSIEVLRTPSAKYDASSSGGIVNVILKKGVKIGRFISIRAGMNQGKYGNRFAGFNYNDGSDLTSYYVNGNYTFQDMIEDLNSERMLNADTLLNQNAQTRRNSHQAYLGYGINYYPNDKITYNYDGRINASFPYSASDNYNIVVNGSEEQLSESETMTNSWNDAFNVQQEFGMVYKIDTISSNIDTKLSYNFNHNNAFQNYSSNYYFPFEASVLGEGNHLQNRHFVQFQSDLTYQFPHKIKLESGVKTSFQHYASDNEYFFNVNQSMIADPIRTNAFFYNENINAAYLQLSKTFWKHLQLKTGVRIEHTFMNGVQTVPTDTSFLLNRADWFPYVYLSRRVLEVKGFEARVFLIYRKTINRPGYQNLSPNIKYVDDFLYETGNPELKPEFTDNFELNISVEDMPLFAVGRSYTRDIISNVLYTDDNYPNIVVNTYDNLSNSTETYLRGMAGIPPGGRYYFAVGAQYNLNEYEGFYDNTPFSYKRGSWRLFTFHSLKLFKNTRITLSGFMMINGMQNFYELKNFGQVNFGITQRFFDDRLTISINGRDILRTMVTQFEMHQGSISVAGSRYSDNQRFGIQIRYNFGLKKPEKKPNEIKYDIDE